MAIFDELRGGKLFPLYSYLSDDDCVRPESSKQLCN